MAAMSTAKLMTSTGRTAMNRSPSATARQSGRWTSPCGGMEGSFSTEYSAAVKSSASAAYARANPLGRTSSSPARSGPTTWPTLPTVKLRVLAAGTSSVGTMRGMIAPRAEDATANIPDWTKTSARISQMFCRSSRVWTSSARVTTQPPIDDHR